MLWRPIPFQPPTATHTFQTVATQWATQNIQKTGMLYLMESLKPTARSVTWIVRMAAIIIKQSL